MALLSGDIKIGNLESMLKVKLPDGNVLEYSRPVRPMDIAADIGPRLAKATLAAVVDGRTVGVDLPLPEKGQIDLRLLTKKRWTSCAIPART
jgi:threonyl-tRNA synthetase